MNLAVALTVATTPAGSDRRVADHEEGVSGRAKNMVVQFEIDDSQKKIMPNEGTENANEEEFDYQRDGYASNEVFSETICDSVSHLVPKKVTLCDTNFQKSEKSQHLEN